MYGIAFTAEYVPPLRASIEPVSLKRTIAARPVKSAAAPDDNPITPSIPAAAGVASNDAVNVPDCCANGWFCQTDPPVKQAGPFATVTLTELLAELPAASKALACTVCAPSATAAVFHAYAYGDAASVAARTPSTQNSTRLTPTLSLADAVTDTTPDTSAPLAGAVTDTTGTVVSGQDEVAALIDACDE